MASSAYSTPLRVRPGPSVACRSSGEQPTKAKPLAVMSVYKLDAVDVDVGTAAVVVGCVAMAVVVGCAVVVPGMVVTTVPEETKTMVTGMHGFVGSNAGET
jgi:hypothetical protein